MPNPENFNQFQNLDRGKQHTDFNNDLFTHLEEIDAIVLNNEDDFEEMVAKKLENIRISLIADEVTRGMKGEKTLGNIGDGVVPNIIRGLNRHGRQAIFYHRNNRPQDAQSILKQLDESLLEITDPNEDLGNNVEVQEVMKLPLEDKLFKLETVLGIHSENSKTNDALRTILDELGNDLRQAIQHGNISEEERLWSVVFGFKNTPPEKLDMLLRKISGILGGLSIEHLEDEDDL